jgi:dihydroorotase
MEKHIEQGLKVAKAQVAAAKSKMAKVKMPKITKKQAMVAGAVAGATLLCSVAGYSIYAIRNNRKKINFKKMKIQVVKGMKSAQEKLAPVAEKASKMAAQAAKDAQAKAKEVHAQVKAKMA